MGSGMYGAIGILSALYHREKTGRGQQVEATLLDTPISWLTWRAAEYWGSGKDAGPPGQRQRCLPGLQVRRRPLGQHRADQPPLARTPARALDIPEVLDDPRFKTQTLRNENHRALTDGVQEHFCKRPRRVDRRCSRRPASRPARSRLISEVLDDDPHVKAREMVVEVDHPVIGKMKALGRAGQALRDARRRHPRRPDARAAHASRC